MKAQVAHLTTYSQQWSSIKLPTTSLALPQLLSKIHIDQLEKTKNWMKATEDWFWKVLYDGNMGIGHVIRTANKFLELQTVLKRIRKFCTNFPELYRITHPKIEAIV